MSLKRNARGKIVAVEIAGNTGVSERKLAKEVAGRHEGARSRTRGRSASR